MSTVRTTPASGVSFLVMAGVLWGTGGLLGHVLADATGLSALAVGTYRLAIGGLSMLGFLLVTGRPLPRGGAAWRRIAAMGALAATFQASYFTAVSLTSVSVATLVTIGSSPVLVIIIRRRAERREVAAVGLALLGLGLLVGLPAGVEASGGALAGAAFALLAAGGFTVMSLLAARPVPGLDAATTTGVGFTLGGGLLAVLAACTTGLGFAPDVGSVGLIVALGLVPTAIAYTCYFRGLRSASAPVGVLMSLLEPLTAAVLSAALLGERLGPAGVAGGLLLGAALVLAARQERVRSA